MDNNQLRDYRFDNLKGIMIFFVVLLHALGKFGNDSMGLVMSLRSVMVQCSMPAFAFISGYLSKDVYLTEKNSTKTVKSILIPFLVAHSLMWLLSSRSISSYFTPRWTLWYLLSLFFWKILIAPISRIRFALIISLVFSICIGFSPADRLLSLSRTVAFFPYFLMGHKTTPTMLDRIRKLHKSIPIFILLALLSIVVLLVAHNLPIGLASSMDRPYSSIDGVSQLQGMVLRVIALIVGSISTLCSLALVPNKNSIMSNIGKTSMTVYLGHSFTIVLIKILLSMTFPALMTNEIIAIIFSLVMSIAICLFFSNKWTVYVYNKTMDCVSNTLLAKN